MSQETEMDIDVGCPDGQWPQPQFQPRKPLPTFTEAAVHTALGLLGVAIIVVAGIIAWLEVSPK
jgi:hypothetical protein